MDFWTAAITIVVAALTGGLASMAAPWAQQRAQAQKDRDQHRRELIATWRAMVSRHHTPGAGIKIDATHNIADDPDWLSLRAHLDDDLIGEFEGGGVAITGDGLTTTPAPSIAVTVSGSGLGPKLRRLTEAIDALERRWELV